MKFVITETEAYCGKKDLACHASRGFTPRTSTMFGHAGLMYVYMIYGMYFCLNIVTGRKGYPAAVLIRGCKLLNPDNQEKEKKINGPGKLCKELKIDKNLNGSDISMNKELWVEDMGLSTGKIKKGKRIGVDYAGKWKNKKWRFYI